MTDLFSILGAKKESVEDFNRQSNILFANFKHANSNIGNALFQNYCTSFYGSQILPLFGNCMEDIYTAWRIGVYIYVESGRFNGELVIICNCYLILLV